MTGSSDDGQAGVTVTEADRETARGLLVTHGMAPRPGVVHAIAAALAAEREKARAPLVALIRSAADGVTAGIEFAWDGSAMVPLAAIRRAAEEGQQ